MDGRILDRQHELDPPVEIAGHPVGRADVDPRLPVGQLVAIAEAPDAAVLEEAADDRLDPNRLGEAGDAGAQAADAAHDEVDLHPGRACLVELVDDYRVDQGV